MKYILLSILFIYTTAICSAQLAPMKQEEIVLHTETGDLFGTLHLPNSPSKKIPIVIFQAGSGPTDRNGNNPLGVTANSYAMLADSLNNHGIAVLLTDKRGIAASKKAVKREEDLLFSTYVDDVVAWTELIEKDDRFKKIFLAGHSEGSLISMLAAEKEKVEGYISISGPGENIKKTVTDQVTKQDAVLGHQLDSLLSRIQMGETITTIPPALLSLLRPSVLPYMKSWMQYDPAIEIAKLKLPILIIQGSTDIQVGVQDATLLHKANPKSQLVIIQGMNHVLKNAPIDRTENIATYSNPNLPIPVYMIDSFVSFIRRNQ